jgi:signal transduction histidine kinase
MKMFHTNIKTKRKGKVWLDYHSLFCNSFIGVIRLNAKELDILEVNNKAFEILGFCNETIKSLRNFLHDIGLIDRLQRANLIHEEINTDEFIERCDGDQRWIRFHCLPENENGHVHILLQDVTAEKKGISELNGLHDHLDQFIYRASHNLRSPLTTLLGLLELARRSTACAESVSDYIRLMTDRVKHLDDLLLELICIVNNETEPIDLRDVYLDREARSVLEEHAQQNKYFTYNISTNQTDAFFTDQERLKIILRNIISNAIKFSNPSTESPHVELFIRTELETAYIMIEDNGIGMDSATLKKIFNLFFKATNNHSGAGLGLYTVRRVVDKLRGSITVTSALDKGTIFTISLPNNRNRKMRTGTIL